MTPPHVLNLNPSPTSNNETMNLEEIEALLADDSDSSSF
jgi:hypothetical protein